MRPYVFINVAATLDGKIDTRDRRGAAISSEADRTRVDVLRSSVDAIVVGGRTLHEEDPRLTVKSETLQAERIGRGEPAQPARVGITSHVDFREDSRFMAPNGGRIILFLPEDQNLSGVELRGVEVYACGQGRVDLTAAFARLTDLGFRRVMVEGGGTLNFELLRLGLVDELQVYLAPMVFGGATAPTLADGDGLSRDAALRLSHPDVHVWEDGGVVLRYMVNPS